MTHKPDIAKEHTRRFKTFKQIKIQLELSDCTDQTVLTTIEQALQMSTPTLLEADLEMENISLILRNGCVYITRKEYPRDDN